MKIKCLYFGIGEIGKFPLIFLYWKKMDKNLTEVEIDRFWDS